MQLSPANQIRMSQRVDVNYSNYYIKLSKYQVVSNIFRLEYSQGYSQTGLDSRVRAQMFEGERDEPLYDNLLLAVHGSKLLK